MKFRAENMVNFPTKQKRVPRLPMCPWAQKQSGGLRWAVPHQHPLHHSEWLEISGTLYKSVRCHEAQNRHNMFCQHGPHGKEHALPGRACLRPSRRWKVSGDDMWWPTSHSEIALSLWHVLLKTYRTTPQVECGRASFERSFLPAYWRTAIVALHPWGPATKLLPAVDATALCSNGLQNCAVKSCCLAESAATRNTQEQLSCSKGKTQAAHQVGLQAEGACTKSREANATNTPHDQNILYRARLRLQHQTPSTLAPQVAPTWHFNTVQYVSIHFTISPSLHYKALPTGGIKRTGQEDVNLSAVVPPKQHQAAEVVVWCQTWRQMPTANLQQQCGWADGPREALRWPLLISQCSSTSLLFGLAF